MSCSKNLAVSDSNFKPSDMRTSIIPVPIVFGWLNLLLLCICMSFISSQEHRGAGILTEVLSRIV